jgi:hypothetical protein
MNYGSPLFGRVDTIHKSQTRKDTIPAAIADTRIVRQTLVFHC